MASQTFFEATENGTKMTDVVHYALPLEAFRKDNEHLMWLKEIKGFAHRVLKVNKIFNSK
jgi:hypothetical protein